MGVYRWKSEMSLGIEGIERIVGSYVRFDIDVEAKSLGTEGHERIVGSYVGFDIDVEAEARSLNSDSL